MLRKTIGLSFITLIACSQGAFAQNLPNGVHELPLTLPPIPFDENLKKLGVNTFNCEFASGISKPMAAAIPDTLFTLSCTLYKAADNNTKRVDAKDRLGQIFIPIQANGTYGKPMTLIHIETYVGKTEWVHTAASGSMIFHKLMFPMFSYHSYDKNRDEYLKPNVSTLFSLDSKSQPVWQYDFTYDLQKDPDKESQYYGYPVTAVTDNGYVVAHYAPEAEWGEYYNRFRDYYLHFELESIEDDNPTVPIVLDRLNAQGQRIKTQQVQVPIMPGTRDGHATLQIWPMDKGRYALSIRSVSIYEKLPIDSGYTILFFNADDTLDHQAQVTLKAQDYSIEDRPAELASDLLVDSQGNILLQTRDEPDAEAKAQGKSPVKLTLYDTNGNLRWHQFVAYPNPSYAFRYSPYFSRILETPQQQYLIIAYQDDPGAKDLDKIIGIFFNQKGEEVARQILLTKEQFQEHNTLGEFNFTFLDNKLWISQETDVDLRYLPATAWQKILTSEGLLSKNLGLHIYTVDLPK